MQFRGNYWGKSVITSADCTSKFFQELNCAISNKAIEDVFSVSMASCKREGELGDFKNSPNYPDCLGEAMGNSEKSPLMLVSLLLDCSKQIFFIHTHNSNIM